MKKLDPKFIYVCGAIISVPILILIILVCIRGCNVKMSYNKYEELMIKRAKSYAKNHKMLPKAGKHTIIKLDNLVDDGMKSPEKALKDSSCNGSVEITNNSNNLSEEKYYFYVPYLECDNYKTEYIKDYMLKDVVTEKSGLYKVGNEYIYKGDKVNNYISIYGDIYRIIKIDEDGNLKLMRQKWQESYNWDGKYNISLDGYVGINNYVDSNILNKLIIDYKAEKVVNNSLKEIIIPHNLCVGKRVSTDKSLNITTECSDILENQVIMLPSITDFTLASYDENCKNIGNLSCTNFNYMTGFLDASWTVDTVSDDTSKVYYIDSLGPELETANKYRKYNWVFYIDSEQLYAGGVGSEKDPYIIK